MQFKSNTLFRKSSYALAAPFFGCLLLAGCQSLVGCRTKTDIAPPPTQNAPVTPPSPPSPSDQAQQAPTGEQPSYTETGVFEPNHSNAVQAASAMQTPNSNASKTASKGLKLTVSGLEPGAGPLRLAIFRSSTSFPNHESASEKHSVEVTGEVVSTEVPIAASGMAIAAYQDLNNDGKLNKGMFGIPTEPYGFSNNAKGSMGPPSFDSAALRSTVAADIKLEKVKL